MIRKILTSGVLAAGTLAGLTVSPSFADAHPPAVGPAYIPVVRPGYYPPGGHDWHHRVRFEVLVRHHGHWDVVDTFRDRDDAWRLARRLRHQGHDVEVRRQ
jgi:hypothetical protein